MRIIAFILGLLGAIVGFVGGAAVAVLGGAAVLELGEFGATFGSDESSVAVWRGMLAVFASVVAVGGAILALGYPRASAAVLFLSAAAGVYLITAMYAPAAVFLLIAALFAFRGRSKSTSGSGRAAGGSSGPQRRRQARGGSPRPPPR